MKPGHKKFVISLSCVLAFTVALTFALKSIAADIVTPLWPWQIMFFALINIVIYFVGVKIKSRGDVSKTTYFYMITTVTKLLLYLAILLTYVLVFPIDAKPFIITFLIYYFCFTIFETFVKIKTNN